MQLQFSQNNKIDRVKVTFLQQLGLVVSCLTLLLVSVSKATANNERLCKLYTEKSYSGLNYFDSIMRGFKTDKLVSFSALIEDLQGKGQYCSLSVEEQQQLDRNVCKVGEYLYFSYREEIAQQFRAFESEGKYHKIPVAVWLEDIGNRYCAYPYKTVYQITSLINPIGQKKQQHLAELQTENLKLTTATDVDTKQLAFSAKQITHFPDLVNNAYQKLLITVQQIFPNVELISFVESIDKEKH
ncbi:hypothetical protein H0A36_23690 [Endozoicomonas sp. SM1973]|uniref:Uncharacterized protein n=1 Tax=Spartinivicinus marinus TaxID=2994442 RepID=A0A853IHY0_9GAMM|nr:hypothetical protein [Spartinivicinus marinus]MCX4026051.1 hypothetical protein [Spartinivicinus marinus]NYZ69027.1 hypothetical protein [Spartinivicinus marinus]